MKNTSNPKPSISSTAAFVIPVALIALIFLIVYPNDLKLQATLTGHSCDGAPTRTSLTEEATPAVAVEPDIRLFIGILSTPAQYARRGLLRLAYKHQPGPTAAHVDVRFVFCNVSKEEDVTLVALEVLHYRDIVVLNCTENMDGGKTYTFFSSLPKLFAGNGNIDNGKPPYDYVMKTDDDTYVRVSDLAESLKTKPRESLYYGLLTPCLGTKDKLHYMSGLGYVLSWDLVKWIAASDVPRKRTTGPEDKVTGEWFLDGGRTVHMYDAVPAMYDYTEPWMPARCFRHKFVPETIAVHKLKTNLEWAKTLRYFNITDGIQPSEEYRVLLKYLNGGVGT